MSYNLDEFIISVEKIKLNKSYILPICDSNNNFNPKCFKRVFVEKINKDSILFKGFKKPIQKYEVSNGLLRDSLGHYGSINAIYQLFRMKVV